MIEQAQGLSPAALEAIAGLERRCLAADGGRLKLEWGTLRSRATDEVRDLLWWEDGALCGFLGIYGYRAGVFEVTGMVDPPKRRRGIGRALLEQALVLLEARGGGQLLLVVPRGSAGGRALANAYGMAHEHSEHALRLDDRPAPATPGPPLRLRPATEADIPLLSRLYLDAFGDGEVNPDRLSGERSRTLVILLEELAVGTIALARDGARGGVYGFVIDAPLRGRGIGGRALRQACAELLEAGAEYVELEVEVDNDRALGLYTALGFRPLATDDYYELVLG
jgi:ribosomal protein S18 acetylase RimI-like enzyme